MQHPIECDEQGCPNYAMCAVNPSCVGKMFDRVTGEGQKTLSVFCEDLVT